MGRGDVADDAVDPAVTGDRGFDVGDQVHQLLGGVGVVLAALPVFVQLGVLQQLAGIYLDLIGAVALPQAEKILPIRFGRGAQ